MFTGNPTTTPSRFWLGGALLVALVFIAYQPVWTAGYVWDDAQYITDSKPLRTWGGFAQIWLQPGATEQYYPLTETTFFIEYQLWGVNPLGYHLDNLLLFAATAILLWRLLLRLGVPGAWLAAAIFALHPVQVESVAWVTERKNMLSGLLFLGSLFMAVRFWKLDVDELEPPHREWSYYAWSLGLYFAALLSKTAVVPLPGVVFLLLWWKRPAQLWREGVGLVPFVMIGLPMGLLTLWVEKHFVGTTAALYVLDFPQRLILIGKTLCFYLGKLIWPWPLIFVYPRFTLDPARPLEFLPLAAVVLVLVLLWRMRRTRWKPVFLAAAYFVVMLSPACGSFNQYYFRYSYVADHLQYLAAIGPLTLFAAGIGTLLRRRMELAYAAAALLLVLATLTWHQARHYRDLESLWRATLADNPNSDLAQYDYGNILLKRGEIDEAAAHFRKALKLNPALPEAHNNLATALADRGRLDDAIAEYQAAIAVSPEYPEAHFNLGLLLARKEGAAAVPAPPPGSNNPEAQGHLDQGMKLAQGGDGGGAIAEYEKAAELDPGNAQAHWRLGVAFSKSGQTDPAIAELQKARALVPADAGIHNDLGIALAQEGSVEAAIAEFQEAVRLKPDYASAQENLAKALALRGR